MRHKADRFHRIARERDIDDELLRKPSVITNGGCSTTTATTAPALTIAAATILLRHKRQRTLAT
jgi:hypothetical protein